MCGADGQTYNNACLAENAGVTYVCWRCHRSRGQVKCNAELYKYARVRCSRSRQPPANSPRCTESARQAPKLAEAAF